MRRGKAGRSGRNREGRAAVGSDAFVSQYCAAAYDVTQMPFPSRRLPGASGPEVLIDLRNAVSNDHTSSLVEMLILSLWIYLARLSIFSPRAMPTLCTCR